MNVSSCSALMLITTLTLLGGTTRVSAADGTIHFTGTISSAACSVKNTAGSASTTGTVDFGVVSSSTLTTVGAATVSTPFSIELADCGMAAAPQITFTGTPVTTAGYTELFATDVKGVGIRIEDAGNTGTYYSSGISADNAGFAVLASKDVTSASGNFNAYLVSHSAGAKEGVIDTSVTFTIDYSNS